MNYKKKSFKELIEIVDDASCELYDRVTKVDVSIKEVFNNIWQGLVTIGNMDRVKGEEEE